MTSCLQVLEPLAKNSFQNTVGLFHVAAGEFHPAVLPETELGEVAVQVLLSTVLVHALLKGT